ncbi:hypothetical protein HBB16_06890 [Pseudonocardia sp. MCCB 268]|nr:hypothetical protein [Pseudonocardia cytotoxica]
MLSIPFVVVCLTLAIRAGGCAGVVRVRRSGGVRWSRRRGGESQDASFRELRFSSGVRRRRALPSPLDPFGVPGSRGGLTRPRRAVCCRSAAIARQNLPARSAGPLPDGRQDGGNSR